MEIPFIFPSENILVCGDEFDIEHEWKVAIIIRALYAGKYAGHDYWKELYPTPYFTI